MKLFNKVLLISCLALSLLAASCKKEDVVADVSADTDAQDTQNADLPADATAADMSVDGTPATLPDAGSNT